MKKKFLFHCSFLYLLLLLLPSAVFSQSLFIITGNGVNVRQGPGVDQKLLFSAPLGSEIELLSKEGEWLQIEFTDNRSGWIHSSFAAPLTKLESTSDAVNVRSGPGPKNPVIAQLQKGETVALLKAEENWMHVLLLKQNSKGYVHDSLLSPFSQSPPVSRLDSPQGAPFKEGRRTMADGSKYIGQFKNGLFHGQGVLTYQDGRKYEGQFQNGMFNGYGEMSLGYGSYAGNWKNGKFDGQGTLTRFDGGKFIGEWDNNRWTGKGSYIAPDGSVYEGEWLNGSFHGQGTMTAADGSVKKGRWANGRFLGP